MFGGWVIGWKCSCSSSSSSLIVYSVKHIALCIIQNIMTHEINEMHCNNVINFKNKKFSIHRWMDGWAGIKAGLRDC